MSPKIIAPGTKRVYDQFQAQCILWHADRYKPAVVAQALRDSYPDIAKPKEAAHVNPE